jgi:penicillin-binding protein 1A
MRKKILLLLLVFSVLLAGCGSPEGEGTATPVGEGDGAAGNDTAGDTAENDTGGDTGGDDTGGDTGGNETTENETG